MARLLGRAAVAPLEHKSLGRLINFGQTKGVNEHDVANRRIFQDKRKRIKSRECMYEHWEPSCHTFLPEEDGGRFGRTHEDPTGKDFRGEISAEDLTRRAEETAEAENICRLARAKHECGDYFSVGGPCGLCIFSLPCFEELGGLPGVFAVDFDSPGSGLKSKKTLQGRYCVLTNASWLLSLGRFDKR